MTAQTPLYGIKYIARGEPIRNTRQALQDNAETIEAALIRGGVVPPAAADLTAEIAARVALGAQLANQLNPPTCTSTTRPTTGLYAGYRARETDTLDLIQYDGAATSPKWHKVGGPPRLLAQNISMGGGAVQVSAFATQKTLALPAHTPGVLWLEGRTIWNATGGQALHSRFLVGSTVVVGSDFRSHNGASNGGPVLAICEGMWWSDGSAQTLALQESVETTAIPASVVDRAITVWLRGVDF